MGQLELEWLLLCLSIGTVYLFMSGLLWMLRWLFRKVHGVRDGLE